MINTYNDTHKGHLPIRVLQHNIVSVFENASPSFREYSLDVIEKNKLDPEIGYTMNGTSSGKNKIIGPHVNIKERKIHLDEIFLAYMWCVCYSLYVNVDQLISRKPTFIPSKSESLFEYAMTLKTKFSPWDKYSLINPERYARVDQEDIEKTNAIFERALAFILCHEFFHIKLAHIESEIYNDNNLCAEMLSEKLENEIEADKEAVELLLSGCDKKNRSATKYGIVFALCALVFLKGKLARDTHPDSDNRILEALEGLHLDENDTCWLVACVSFDLWQEEYRVLADWEEKGSFKDTFLYVSRQVD